MRKRGASARKTEEKSVFQAPADQAATAAEPLRAEATELNARSVIDIY